MLETYKLSDESEIQFLGSCLIRPETISEYPLEPDDFRKVEHREIYKVLCGGYTDSVVVAEKAGVPVHTISDLKIRTISALNAGQHHEQILTASQNRKLVGIAQDMVNDVQKGSADPVDYSNRIMNTVRVKDNGETLPDAVSDLIEYARLRKQNPNPVWGIPSPWNDFNKISGGLHRQESILLFGESGIGKTVAGLQMGYHAAKLGYSVSFYELEMTTRNLLLRLTSMHTGIPTQLVHSGMMNEKQTQLFEKGLAEIEAMPIHITDGTWWTSADIRADQKKRGASDLIVVDYLGLLKDKADNPYMRAEIAAVNLRQMAKELNSALVVISSMVKDGTIKGTAEVKYAQDMAWYITRPDGVEDKNDPVRKLVPDKLRNDAGFYHVELVMKQWRDKKNPAKIWGLPLLEQHWSPAENGHSEAVEPEWSR